jgi:undecaprenyl phosphate-alpha-L-ara4N flippase subunit ArnE
MNRTLLMFGLLAQVALVLGQFLLKVAMHPRSAAMRGAKYKRAGIFVLSIAAQTVYFFLWLGLLEKFELSKVYPFDAAAPVLLVLAAVFLLHERLTVRAWVAISFIFAGLAIISVS